MKTSNRTLIFGLGFLNACSFGGGEIETPVSSASRFTVAPLPDAAERHAAVTFTIAEGSTNIQDVKVGGGPSRSYPRENKPVQIELLDRNGEPFDQVVIDDPRQLRVYDNGAATGSPPHSVVQVQEAEATIVLPLDPRLDAILVSVGSRDRGRPLAVGDAIAEQCERDESDACRTFLRRR